MGNLKIIKETVPDPTVGISPEDASFRNISSGAKIRIFNQIGEIISIARISNRVQEGTVVLPNGIWYNEGGGGNHLIDARETDMGYGAAPAVQPPSLKTVEGLFSWLLEPVLLPIYHTLILS